MNKCCKLGCENDAVFWIGKNPLDDHIYACDEHQFELKGEGDTVVQLSGPEKAWARIHHASDCRIKKLEADIVTLRSTIRKIAMATLPDAVGGIDGVGLSAEEKAGYDAAFNDR